jgi:hypothetical protein
MGMVLLLFLVVVGQFNVKGVRSFKTKNNASVGPHRHGPEAFQIAFERMKMITGEV